MNHLPSPETILKGTIAVIAGARTDAGLGRFGGQAVRADFELGSIAEKLALHAVDAIVLEVDPPIADVFPFVRKVRTVMKKPTPVFLICRGPVIDSGEAFFEGIESVFARPISDEDIAKGIAFALECRKGHNERKHERTSVVRARVTFKAGSIETSGFATNFSRGGMFVGSMGALPKPGERIEFTIYIDDGPGAEVSGQGIVRWLRPNIQYGRPRGFGLQFDGLDAGSLAIIESICVR